MYFLKIKHPIFENNISTLTLSLCPASFIHSFIHQNCGYKCTLATMLNTPGYPNKNVEGFPGGAVVEHLPANAGHTGSSPGLGRPHMPRSN